MPTNLLSTTIIYKDSSHVDGHKRELFKKNLVVQLVVQLNGVSDENRYKLLH